MSSLAFERVAVAVMGAVALACAEPRPPARPPSHEVAAPERVRWPALVAGAGDARLHASAATGRRFAWLAAGTPIQPRGPVEEGRVRVAVDGPLRVRGWVNVHALGAMVLERGRLGGAPLYLVPGDEVRIVAVRGARALVEGSAHLGHPRLARSPQFRGTFPLERLGAEPSGGGVGPTPGGSPIVLPAGTALLDAPGGAVVWTVPHLEPPLTAMVLRDGSDHLGVRIGSGPFLVGYVARAALGGGSRKQDIHDEVIDPWAARGDRTVVPSPSMTNPWGGRPAASVTPVVPVIAPERTPELVPEADDPSDGAESWVRSGLPPRLGAAVVRSVWQVRAGARLRVDGATVAIFDQPGFAVEIDREGAEVEVLAAVDETVTVRGMVDASDLERLERLEPAPSEEETEPEAR